MYPILWEFTVAGTVLVIGAYRFFGLLAATYLLLCAFRILKDEVSGKTLFFLSLLLILSFLLGSRILYGLLYWERVLFEPSLLLSLKLRNFTLFGGLLLSFGVWILLSKKLGLKTLPLTDRLVFHVGIATACIRLGCFLNGCCYGKPTNSPLGVAFPQLLRTLPRVSLNPFQLLRPEPTLQAVHPTQLYELVVALLAAFLALLLQRLGKRPGHPTFVFALVLSAGRLLVFSFRDFPEATFYSNLLRGPILYGMSMLVALYCIYRNPLPTPKDPTEKRAENLR